MSGRRPAIVLGIVGAAVACAGLWIAADRIYLSPAAELRSQIADATSALQSRRNALAEASETRDVIDDFARNSLGRTRETVDHQLRTQLNRLAEACGLREPVSTTGRTKQLDSPMRTAFPRRGVWASLRDQPDLVEMEGQLTGTGSLANVLELLGRLRAAPWPIRVDRLRLTPARGGAINMQVSLTTAYLPVIEGLAEGGDGPLALTPDDLRAMPEPAPGVAMAAARLLARDPFELPKPVEVAAAPPEDPPTPPPTPPPPGFPWDQWRLTGVAVGPSGPEAWLRNDVKGESIVLVPGDSLDDARLVALGKEDAEFARGDHRFRVLIGRSMAPATRNSR